MKKMRRGSKVKKTVKEATETQSPILSAAGKWRGMTLESPQEEKPKEDDVRRRFSIDAEVLKKIQHKHGPRKKMSRIEPTVENYYVRKLKPKEKKMKTVIVMKPVESDCQVTVRPIEFIMNYTGPRFTDHGKFIPHSILGSLEDFRREAKRRGENLHLLKTHSSAGDLPKTSKKLKVCNSLKKWNTRIDEWNKAQNYLSSKLHRPVEDLLMRTANVYPAWVDSRVETGQALKATVSGYGEKRVNSQFWKQHINFGQDDDTAIWSTLKHSETGDCCPKEFRQVPDLINLEKDKGKIIPERSYKHYYTDYLNQQRENVKDVIHILNPHHPDLADLMVQGKGQSQKTSVPSFQEETSQGHITLHRPVSIAIFRDLDPRSCSSSSEYDSFKGPALAIGQHILTWKNLTGENPIRPLTLTFRSRLGQIQIKKIPMMNYGSTQLRYYWEKVPVENPFGFVKRRLQQYYFFTEDGILPPCGDIQLPVMFKSDFPGNFKERWKLKTRPVLCGGADILINFKAIASEPIIHPDHVAEIEKKFMQKEIAYIVNSSIQNITSRVVTPARLLSPIVTYLSPEEEFSQSYPGLFYHSAKLKQMEELYDAVCNSDLMTTKPEASFTVNNLKQAICMLDLMELPPADRDNYEEILQQKYSKQLLLTNEYTTLTTDMSFKHLSPYTNINLQHNFICQQVLHEMIESFTHSAFIMTYKTGFPVNPLEPEEKIDKKSKRRNSILPKQKKGNEQKNTLSPSHGRQTATSASKNRKKGAASPQKDSMPPIPIPLPPHHVEFESFSPLLDTASPKQLSSYREKLYMQGYSMLQEAIDRIESIFIDLDETSHWQM